MGLARGGGGGGGSPPFEGELGGGGGGGGGGGDPPLLKCSWTGGVVDFKDGLPGADSIFFNTVTTHQAFF